MHSLHTLTQISETRILTKWSQNDYTVVLLENLNATDLPDFTYNKQISLYNHPHHLFLQSRLPVYSFILTSPNNQLCWIHFRKVNEQLLSPAKAPFGSFEGDIAFPPESISFFLKCITETTEILGIRKVIIKNPPGCYPYSCLTNIHYLRHQFRLESSFQNMHIVIDPFPFANKIADNQRRRLFKGRKSNFHIKQIPVDTRLYSFICQCRNERRYGISMTYEELQLLKQTFPKNIISFGVFDAEKLICATVAIKVCEQVLYNFLPASLLEYNNFSPVIMLNESLYNYCQKEQISILDLGISIDEKGIEKPSLARFKREMGALVSDKTTWSFTKD
jgi:hypothetical protein